MSDAVPNARGERSGEKKEDFVAPILFPLPPSRFYFLFGSPVETGKVAGKAKKEEAEEMYAEVSSPTHPPVSSFTHPPTHPTHSSIQKQIKSEVERGISALLSARQKDPFRDFPSRLAYETATRTKAPSFSVEALEEAYRAAGGKK